MANRGTKRGLEYARLAMGFANVRGGTKRVLEYARLAVGFAGTASRGSSGCTCVSSHSSALPRHGRCSSAAAPAACSATATRPACSRPRGTSRPPQAMLAIQKGTRVLISLWDSLMFGRVLYMVPTRTLANPIARYVLEYPFVLSGSRKKGSWAGPHPRPLLCRRVRFQPAKREELQGIARLPF